MKGQTKTKGKRIAVCLLALLAAALAVFFLVRGARSSGAFRGSCMKNSDSYTLDIENMNGTDGHTLELRQGDTLQIHFAVEKGSIKLSITAPDGAVLYTGNGMEATDFTVNIPADGIYAISVEARQAKGAIQISIAGR